MYNEKTNEGNSYRKNYYDGINVLIAAKKAEAENNRRAYAKEAIANPEAYRKELFKMLGWPLCLEENTEAPKVEKTFVAKDGEVSIYRMVINVFDIPFYGILFVKEDGVPRPLVIAQHGGRGCPELCSDFFDDGSRNYNSMVKRVLEYDVNVFAPQLLLWGLEFIDKEDGKEYDTETYTNSMRLDIDKNLRQLGSSVTALEIYEIKRAIDYFAEQPYVLKDKIGMLGLSYGGFYTLYTTACEPRIKTALSCCAFNDRVKYNWPDWTWHNAANTFCDAQVAMLVYPRKLFIAVGISDELFDVKSAACEFEKVCSCFENNDWIRLEQFDGGHEFIKDNDILDSFIQELTKK